MKTKEQLAKELFALGDNLDMVKLLEWTQSLSTEEKKLVEDIMEEAADFFK